MPHPSWLAYGLAVLMVAVSVYCIARLVLFRRLGRRNHVDVNVSHVLMGFAMVGMLVPRWNVIPNAIWELVFGGIALYFLALSVQFVVKHGVRGTDGDHVSHLSHYSIHMVMGCAMLYMYWLGMPITAPSGTSSAMSGPPVGVGDPGLTLLIIAVLIASAVWQTDSMSQFSPARQLAMSGAGGGATVVPTAGRTSGVDERPWLAPRLEIGCHVAMCFTMAYMLILMV